MERVIITITETTWEIVSLCLGSGALRSESRVPHLEFIVNRSESPEPHLESPEPQLESPEHCSGDPEIDELYDLLSLTQHDDASDKSLGLPNRAAHKYRKNIAIPRYLAKKEHRNWNRKIHPSRSVAAQKRKRNRGKFQTTEFVPVPQVHSKTTA
jgi:hypothetical protein